MRRGWETLAVSTLEFVASLVRSLAWPAALIAVVLLLRRPIVELLAAPLKRLKVGPAGFEAEWWRTAQWVAKEAGAPALPNGELGRSEFQREMLELAQEASPIAAVVTSLARVEQALRATLAAHGADDLQRLNSAELVRLARDEGLVDDAAVNAVDGLGVMHMLAVLDQGGRHLDMRRTEEFVALAEAVSFTLRMQDSRHQTG